MNSFLQRWRSLPERQKRSYSIAAVIALAVTLLVILSDVVGDEPDRFDPEIRTEEASGLEEPAGRESGFPTIPGTSSGDFKVNLENSWGLEWSGPQTGADGTYFDEGEARDPDTGALLLSSIHGEGPSDIAFFECNVESGTLDLATAFLSYCATVPFQGAEPQDARTWVERNTSSVEVGSPTQAKFGGVTFLLSGNPPAFLSLEISAL